MGPPRVAGPPDADALGAGRSRRGRAWLLSYGTLWEGDDFPVAHGIRAASNAETYDAPDRCAEQYNGSAYTETVYGPAGNKMARMSVQAVTKALAPLSGGARARRPPRWPSAG